eukprot:symbB.v1.2.002851.t1/scaffold130.1/size334612/2
MMTISAAKTPGSLESWMPRSHGMSHLLFAMLLFCGLSLAFIGLQPTLTRSLITRLQILSRSQYRRMMSHFMESKKMDPEALVLAPTRELARQIQLEALRFGRSSGILCCSCTGGESKAEQLEWLKRGCHIIVATPGRLNEFCEKKQVWLGQISYLTLDEADRMLDMGFEPQIRRIIEECPKERQTLLFSATWPKAQKGTDALLRMEEIL